MASNIGEASWKAFTRKQKLELDDGALLKALAKFDKTDAAKPEPRIQALDEVLDQAKKQMVALARKKKELGDKPFNEAKSELDGLISASEKLLKEARASAQAASVQASSEDEETDSPVLLTAKMVPLVRELRKGEARMPALICVAGKDTAVLIMRRAIPASRRKMLAEFLGAHGSAKYIPAECLFEAQALTFVVQSGAAGLAKRLKAALFAQVEMRLKVRVRGDDPQDVDEEGEEDGAPEAGQERTSATTAGQAEDAGAPSAEAVAYERRLEALSARLAQALAAKHPESSKLRAVSGFASEKAAAGDFAGAGKALQMLETLLGAGATVKTEAASGTAVGESPSVEPATAFKARLGALMPRIQAAQALPGPAAAAIKAQVAAGGVAATRHDYDGAGIALDEAEKLLAAADALAAWQSVRKSAVQSLQAVAGKIASARHAASAKALIELNAVIKNLTEAPWSQAQVDELRRYLGSDDVVHDVCDLDVDIRTPMMRALETLRPLVPN